MTITRKDVEPVNDAVLDALKTGARIAADKARVATLHHSRAVDEAKTQQRNITQATYEYDRLKTAILTINPKAWPQTEAGDWWPINQRPEPGKEAEAWYGNPVDQMLANPRAPGFFDSTTRSEKGVLYDSHEGTTESVEQMIRRDKDMTAAANTAHAIGAMATAVGVAHAMGFAVDPKMLADMPAGETVAIGTIRAGTIIGADGKITNGSTFTRGGSDRLTVADIRKAVDDVNRERIVISTPQEDSPSFYEKATGTAKVWDASVAGISTLDISPAIVGLFEMSEQTIESVDEAGQGMSIDMDHVTAMATKDFEDTKPASAPVTLAEALATQPAPAGINLNDVEQYRMQMAGISTASYGYHKLGDPLHPDYDTQALRDVCALYAKYDVLFKFIDQNIDRMRWTADVRKLITGLA